MPTITLQVADIPVLELKLFTSNAGWGYMQ